MLSTEESCASVVESCWLKNSAEKVCHLALILFPTICVYCSFLPVRTWIQSICICQALCKYCGQFVICLANNKAEQSY
uniref:Uncharacterized protein n=1 Tax=Triticum urartu TaxID=4572 RepID=A0A8R7QUH8_TRIUA